jgi:hypothetical protein
MFYGIVGVANNILVYEFVVPVPTTTLFTVKLLTVFVVVFMDGLFLGKVGIFEMVLIWEIELRGNFNLA